MVNALRIRTISEQYHALGQLVRETISSRWIETNEILRTTKQKQVYYLSIEFLLGRLLGNNLLIWVFVIYVRKH